MVAQVGYDSSAVHQAWRLRVGAWREGDTTPIASAPTWSFSAASPSTAAAGPLALGVRRFSGQALGLRHAGDLGVGVGVVGRHLVW